VNRKLASVRKIGAIEPILGPDNVLCDNIVCATVDGWKLVTQKTNNFKVNDLVCYFEIDSFLPVCERYEFLRKSSFKSTQNLGDGFRIKTIKLRGQVSQGLILPMDEFFEYDPRDGNYYKRDGSPDYLVEGDDLTEYLDIQKYEKPIPSNLSGRARGNFPIFIAKTDQERLQNVYNKYKHRYEDMEFEVTLKLDGSSTTVYHNEGLTSVCSRNLDLVETDDNLFWKVARKSGLIDFLEDVNHNIAFQGELMGPGVQNNREQLKDHSIYLFDIWNIEQRRYLTPKERIEYYDLTGLYEHVNHIPVINHKIKVFKEFPTLDAFLDYADSISSLKHPIAEGLVFKSHEVMGPTFKVISNKFLLKEKD
jgi:RNA ligase (TIGR02306 family)